MNDYSSQDLSNKNSFNLNSDDSLQHHHHNHHHQQPQQQNMVNITKSFQETFRSVFPNAHISFGGAQATPQAGKLNSLDQATSGNTMSGLSSQLNSTNKNQFMIDDQLLKRNCWPDDPAIVSLNDGSNDLNSQRLDKRKFKIFGFEEKN